MGEQAIRFGIVGCASIARKVARAIDIAPNAVVLAVGSRSLEKAQHFIAENGLAASVKPYGSYEEVLEDPAVDAAYLPLPTSLHVRWAVLAAEKKKHVFLEKPTALSVADLDKILEACESNGVQFMDGTVWVHHPRTAKIQELLSDQKRFGKLNLMDCVFTLGGDPDFLKNDIRVKPDLDALGALGDLGWYAIRALLLATGYELPKTVVALPGHVTNDAGVIMSCGSAVIWEDGKVATFHCSFLSHLTMGFHAVGTGGTLLINDVIIPFEEKSASFSFASGCGLNGLLTGWEPFPGNHVVHTDVPQEALMITEFSKLAASIRDSASKPEKKWPDITRKTQLVVDAVKESIDKGYKPVEIAH